jgi:hypothetical protein
MKKPKRSAAKEIPREHREGAGYHIRGSLYLADQQILEITGYCVLQGNHINGLIKFEGIGADITGILYNEDQFCCPHYGRPADEILRMYQFGKNPAYWELAKVATADITGRYIGLRCPDHAWAAEGRPEYGDLCQLVSLARLDLSASQSPNLRAEITLRK